MPEARRWRMRRKTANTQDFLLLTILYSCSNQAAITLSIDNEVAEIIVVGIARCTFFILRCLEYAVLLQAVSAMYSKAAETSLRTLVKSCVIMATQMLNSMNLVTHCFSVSEITVTCKNQKGMKIQHNLLDPWMIKIRWLESHQN